LMRIIITVFQVFKGGHPAPPVRGMPGFSVIN